MTSSVTSPVGLDASSRENGSTSAGAAASDSNIRDAVGADPSPITAAVRRQAAYTLDADLYETRTRLLHHWRHRAVDLLGLRSGDVVLDIGCGTGLCFDLLQERIGPDGMIVGIDASGQMLDLARRRIADHGWGNVALIESPVEEAMIRYQADHVLFCAVHDVLQSPAALRNIFAHARPGATVASVGGKWAQPWAIGLNTLTGAIHAPFIRDFAGFDRPWSRLTAYLTDVRIHEIEMGCGYLASGRTPGRAPV